MQEVTKAQLRSTEPYCSILAVLKCGKENALPAREVCRLANVTERKLRTYMETIRQTIVVCSGVTGYYYPSNDDELDYHIAKTEKTAFSLHKSLKAARRLRKRRNYKDQLRLPI